MFNDPDVSVFKVAGKLFAIGKPRGRAAPGERQVRSRAVRAATPRSGRDGAGNTRHWLTIEARSDFEPALIRDLVQDSYALVNPHPQETAS